MGNDCTDLRTFSYHKFGLFRRTNCKPNSGYHVSDQGNPWHRYNRSWKKNLFFVKLIYKYNIWFFTSFWSILPEKKKKKIKACFSYLYMDSNFSAGYPMAIIRSHIYVRSKSYFLFEISSTCLCLFLDTMVFKADAIFILQKKGSFGQIF